MSGSRIMTEIERRIGKDPDWQVKLLLTDGSLIEGKLYELNTAYGYAELVTNRTSDPEFNQYELVSIDAIIWATIHNWKPDET